MNENATSLNEIGNTRTPKRFNYRKLAFSHYPKVCAHCGFGIADVLEVAHIDGNRSNNVVSNLVILCPTCHKMHDLDLISTSTIIEVRDRPKVVVWAKRMKDAGRKAAATRKHRMAGIKAAATRAVKRTRQQSSTSTL
ncbi:MAG: HNH endonuclease [Planctomycetota bacterium]